VGFIFWSIAGFISGSIPFSLILGRVARRVDIREVGDHNPGAWNVMRAAGWQWGLLAILLDALKGAIPVGLAWFGEGLHGWEMAAVALSPILGHAYSPWLKFRGGKAVATTFGVWSGLTIGAGPTVLGLLLGVFFIVLESSGWSVIIAFMLFGFFIKPTYLASFPEFGLIWLGNYALLIWKHRGELECLPRFRPSVLKWARGLLQRGQP